MEEFIQCSIPSKDSSVKGIINGRQGMQDLEGQSSDSQVEEFIQCSMQSKDSPVEGIVQGMQDWQDLKGEPPDSEVEAIMQYRGFVAK